MRRIGGSSRILSLLTLGAGVLGVVFIGTIAVAPEATASHLGTIEERRAQREAEREARQAEREAERAAREAEEAAEEQTCSCSARLRLSRPDVQWRNNVLTFVPRFDVSIRTSGEASAPDWSADLSYGGQAVFASEDVVVPAPVSFNGAQHVAGGACGNNRYTFSGLALEPVSLGSITRALVGQGEELDGVLKMQARIEGCGFEEESRQVGFTVKEFGNLRAGSWRTVR